MSELDLAAAVAAARRTADAVTSDPAATRRRIRESLERRRGGRARRFTLIGVLAATLFGSTAFAYYAKPWRHEHVASTAPRARAIDDAVGTAEDVDAPRLHEHHVVADDTAAMVEAPPAHVETPPAHVETPRVEAPPARVKTPRVEAPTPPQADPELAAYRVAYDAHFHGAAPAAALAAWDAYLAAYPNGKLATDARYNRAIILVKLERYRDAAEALRPLARSRPEAARLLEALPH